MQDGGTGAFTGGVGGGEEEMIKEIFLTLVIKALSKGFPLLSKKIYSESEFKKHIDIDVQSSNPIEISLNREIPEIRIYIKITNRSPYLDVKLNRAVFSLWVNSNSGSQPLLDTFWVLSPTYIKKGESEGIFCRKDLNKSQIDFVKERKDSKEVTASLSSFKSWFDSSLYPSMLIETNLENKPCKVS